MNFLVVVMAAGIAPLLVLKTKDRAKALATADRYLGSGWRCYVYDATGKQLKVVVMKP